MHILEYYSAMRTKAVLPFATTWVNLEVIRHRKTNST